MLRALDPLSLQTCRRLLVTVALMMLWARMLSPQGVWFGVATMSGACAVIAAGVALLCRERVMGPTLNRWDEATALLGLHLLARAMA